MSAGEPSCAAAAARAIDLGRAALQTLPPAQREATLLTLPPMRDAMHARCRAEAWDAKARACFAGAASAAAIVTCNQALPAGGQAAPH